MTPSGIITLTTDFGDSDNYVGIMKGVILEINPAAQIVDICHNVQSYNLLSASFMLWSAYRWFPRGTVHCVVVDPGVGSSRDSIAVEYAGMYFVLPDNGIMGMTLSDGGEYAARVIDNKQFMKSPLSDTFHGRDIFSPVSAHLSKGAKFEDVGPYKEVIDLSANTAPVEKENAITGAVVHIDRFGNYITNIKRTSVENFSGAVIFVKIGGFSIMGLSRTYSDKQAGELIAYFGSSGVLEIGASKSSAADLIGAPAGSEVKVLGKKKAGDGE